MYTYGYVSNEVKEIAYNLMEIYYFYCSESNEPIQEIGKASTHFLCVEVPSRCFAGTIIGVYTIGDMAEFSYFEVNGVLN